VLEFRDRILRGGLLGAAEPLSVKAESPRRWHGINVELLATPSWIQQNTPSLEDVETYKLDLSLDGGHVIRTIHCRNTLSDELLEVEVRYDIPPANDEDAKQQHRRNAMHRQREEAVLRSLDVVAAAEYRCKRAKLRHN